MKSLLFGPARQEQIETVIHLATHRSTYQQARSHQLNVDTVRQMLDLLEQHPSIRHLVYKSWGEIYQIRGNLPTIINESHPINMSRHSSRWVRDRVEADLTLCSRMNLSNLTITILRCSECLAPGCGSQLFHYLQSSLCLVPLGFDPMINVLSLEDLTTVLTLASQTNKAGVFNIPGKDSLPLTVIIHNIGRQGVPLPGPGIRLIDDVKRRLFRPEYSYFINQNRFHFGFIMSGQRARDKLGYRPQHGIDWNRLRRQLKFSQPDLIHS
jgi:UDP-glucose 4-epimerase